MNELRGLDYAWNQVREFHEAFGHPVGLEPKALTEERKKVRVEWIKEELQELLEADTLVDQVDANLDVLYLTLGNLVEMGVFPQSFMDIVQNANMGKLWEDGKPRYREDGKIEKPEGWKENHAPEPHLLREISFQQDMASKYSLNTLIWLAGQR